jgi:hypothetical protein
MLAQYVSVARNVEAGQGRAGGIIRLARGYSIKLVEETGQTCVIMLLSRHKDISHFAAYRCPAPVMCS